MDRLSKITHFTLCSKSVDASYVAKSFLNEIVSGLPSTIVFDRDVKFVSYRWKML